MVTEIGNSIPQQCFQRFSLGAHLPRTSRVGCNAHVVVRHGVERIRGAAGTELDERSRLEFLSFFVNGVEELRQLLDGIFRVSVMVSGVKTRWRRVHVLAVEFEPVETPFTNDLANELALHLYHVRISRA